MTQYNSVNVSLLDSEHNKLKSAVKSETRITVGSLSKCFGTIKINSRSRRRRSRNLWTNSWFGWIQGSFIYQVEWTPFKSLIWNTNDSITNIANSLTSGVSLWDIAC